MRDITKTATGWAFKDENGAAWFIPFGSASETRVQAAIDAGAEVIDATVAAGPSLEDKRASASLSRFDFASRAAQAGFVTYPEAAAWATGSAMPAKVQALIDSLPKEQQGPILLDVLAMPAIRRNGHIMPAIIAAFGATEEQADALFGIE